MGHTVDTIRDVKIVQEERGYRFSIDSLLLAEFVNLHYPERIADLGAGSGIIGILLAKRYPRSSVFLLEIQEGLSKLARRNRELNNLGDRVSVCHSDIVDISSTGLSRNSFDLVVSNPPFRKTSTGKVSPCRERAVARHEIHMSLQDLVRAAFFLLRGKGRFCFISHPGRLVEISGMLKEHRFEPKRLRFIHSHMRAEASMFLMEAIKEGKPHMTVEKPFFIYDSEGRYTEEALNVLKCRGNEERI